MVTARQLIRETAALFAQNGMEEAEYEARLLAESLSGLSHTDILMGKPFPESQISRLQELIRKRLTGIPVQYLLGQWEFFGLSFYVGEGVLIPRPDTEILVETALSHLQKCACPCYLDLCSGTGCIPIAVGENLPQKKACAVEYEEAAFSYLQKNTALHRADYLTPLLADALAEETISRFAEESLDCITSNPPYLNDADMKNLQKEVQFEPQTALYAPENGLYFYRMISKLWKTRLKQGGLLAFEVGMGQAEAVAGLLEKSGFTNIRIQEDLSGIGRVVLGYRPKKTGL